MNEALLEMARIQDEMARIQQVMSYGLLFIAVLDFLGLMVTAWCLYLVRGTRASVERVSQSVERVGQILARVDERSERLGYYLFSKLGPTDAR